MRKMLLRAGFLLIFLVGGVYFAPGGGEAFTLHPESLSYSVDVPLLKDAARAEIIFRQIGPDCYEGEIRGHTRGILGFFTAHRRDRYRTRMNYRQGKLWPTNYWEESWRHGRHYFKEYRFDYEQGRLELWQAQGEGPAKLKWHIKLGETVYDPISAFYNFRLGSLGEIKGGETITVRGIPYPHPEEIIIRIGPVENGNRKVAVTLRNRAFENESGIVHILFDPQQGPVEAWTRVLIFGKITGRLLGEPVKARVGKQDGDKISPERLN